MNKEAIQNALAFLERTPLTGKEAFAWCQTYGELQAALSAPVAVPATEVKLA